MSEYYEGKYGPLFNKQYPVVSNDHVIAAGFEIRNEGTDLEVFCPCGNYMGLFNDVTWGHGASGVLFIKGTPLSIPSDTRMAEIKAARKKLEEADLQHATNKVCQNRSWKAFMKQATDIIDQMKLCDTVFIYCDADQKMEIEKIGNNAIKLTVKEI